MRARARSPFTRLVPSHSKGCSASLTVVFIPADTQSVETRRSINETYRETETVTESNPERNEGTGKELTYRVQQQQPRNPAPHHQASHCYGCGLVDGNLLGTQLHKQYRKKVERMLIFKDSNLKCLNLSF